MTRTRNIESPAGEIEFGLSITDAAPDTAGGGGLAKSGGAQYQKIEPGGWTTPKRYIATSDGFVLCTIFAPNASWGPGCICWGYAQTAHTCAYVTGGMIGFFGVGWAKGIHPNPRSCLLPVGEGAEFGIGILQNTDGQQMNTTYDFQWISPSGAHLGNPINAARESEPSFAPPPLPQCSPVDNKDRREFVALLERMLGTPIDEETRRELIALAPGL